MTHEENGQIIVDELRPMSELYGETKDYEIFMIVQHPHLGIEPAHRKGVSIFLDSMRAPGMAFDHEDFIGWRKMPIYRPKGCK